MSEALLPYQHYLAASRRKGPSMALDMKVDLFTNATYVGADTVSVATKFEYLNCQD
jgi:hypothetical protein